MSSNNFVTIIQKKKQKCRLTKEDIQLWVDGVVNGSIPDYQSSALLMAIRLNDMDFEETLNLTLAMADSGDRLAFSGFPTLADKHSTGGVGDKVTLILAPMVAACGLPVTMLSGRGLGFTGGTIDKFEALEGVSCQKSQAEMQAMLEQVGWANAQATAQIAPADRVLYALRDVTATVDSIPLITASILSKKLAGGASHLSLDVKCGSSAFMQNISEAKKLAENLVTIGKMGNLSVEAFITHMEEPLGHAVGNYLELLESVLYLKEERHTPLMELVYTLGVSMLTQTGFCKNSHEAKSQLEQTIRRGTALQKLVAYLSFNGGTSSAIDRLLTQDFNTFSRTPISAQESGVVTKIYGRGLGIALVGYGAGRSKASDLLDPIAGLVLNKHLGDQVTKGEPLAWAYGQKALEDAGPLMQAVNQCYSIGEHPLHPKNVILHSL